ncbi:hypothetical protein [Priestia endophytica]|uniref:hypothetical protein n=1 Tax=Priestia endophytica TaxID=135735 RepID=UPI00227DD083|nr:hypothetical protein [Priestia endophytica]MCY8233891.1 hypothetical protein [Priestia endophytica]
MIMILLFISAFTEYSFSVAKLTRLITDKVNYTFGNDEDYSDEDEVNDIDEYFYNDVLHADGD